MFWCDGISQADYKAFGTVIAFDTTYKVNAYQKPFVIIVGVNHHRKTVPIGVALVANEKTDTYIWVLQKLLEAGGGVAPYTVVTDGDKSMAKAIKAVLSNSHHRLCLWHLKRNIKGHTNKKFCSGFMHCVDGCRTQAEFEEAWEELLEAYPAVKGRKWVTDLYNNKEKWAEAFMHGHFYAGMRSTQRCESMNSTFKIVLTSKLMLYKFVELYDQVLEHLRFEEDKDDYISTHTFPVVSGVLSEIKTQAARTYTRNIYDLFCKELNFESRHIVIRKEKEDRHRDGVTISYWLNDCVRKNCKYLVCHNLKLQQIVCCCMKLESIGIPCRHMFAVMKYEGMTELPEGCILRRWTMKAKTHLSNPFKQFDIQKANDEATSNGRFAFLIGLSNQLCRMASTSYERSIWLRDRLAKMLVDTEKEKIYPKKKDIIPDESSGRGKGRGKGKKMKFNDKATKKEPIGQEKCDVEVAKDGGDKSQAETTFVSKHGGFVDLLKEFMPRTHTSGDAMKATDSYEISIFQKFPTIFDWDPKTDF